MSRFTPRVLLPLAALVAPITLIALVALATGASAQDPAQGAVPALTCEPPISICNVVDPEQPLCPDGYDCVCVGSCPLCDDCAAEVCVRAERPQCRTACDCAAGQGCFDGQCLAGFRTDPASAPEFVPVYCCDGDVCPAGNLCQGRDGRMDRCEPDPIDPSCRERVEKIRRFVARWVERGSRCRVDSDCVHIDTSTQCQGSCGAVVNRGSARRIHAAIMRADKKVCLHFRRDGCPFATPGCLPVEPACVDNRCIGAPSMPGPPDDRIRSDVDAR